MTFLTPLSAILAAAIAIPALLLLYFLKLRRHPVRVASTLLWMKSVDDLQVNAPFQRLRISLLFLLQLLALLLFLTALARPVMNAPRAAAQHTILLIDTSASMQTLIDKSGEMTRLDRAKSIARNLIDQISRDENAHEVMIIAFARTAGVVSPFGSSRSTLFAAVDAIAATDEPANLIAAAKLANAFAAQASDETTDLPNIVLISDGSVQTTNENDGPTTLQAASIKYVQVGASAPNDPIASNRGIVSLSARRNPESPTKVEVFSRLLNTASVEDVANITLRVDGRVAHSRRIEIPAAHDDSAPGLATATFNVDLPYGGVVTLVISGNDALLADDRAAIVVPPPAQPRITIIAPDGSPDPFMWSILESVETEEITVLSPAQFEQQRAEWAEGEKPDLVIFDRSSPVAYAPASSITLGGAPPAWSIIKPTSQGGRRFRTWNRSHPIMRHVELDDIIFAGFGGYVVLQDERDRFDILATGADGPVMVSTQRENHLHIFIGFELIESNWPAHVSFAVFMRNVLDQTIFGRGVNEGRAYSPGDSIQVDAVPDATTIEIEGPVSASVDVEGRSRVTLPSLRRAGIYRLTGVPEPNEVIAINLANAEESDIRPRAEVSLNAAEVRGVSALRATARELWPWFIAAALVVITLEWMVYLMRLRV